MVIFRTYSLGPAVSTRSSAHFATQAFIHSTVSDRTLSPRTPATGNLLKSGFISLTCVGDGGEIAHQTKPGRHRQQAYIPYAEQPIVIAWIVDRSRIVASNEWRAGIVLKDIPLGVVDCPRVPQDAPCSLRPDEIGFCFDPNVSALLGFDRILPPRIRLADFIEISL